MITNKPFQIYSSGDHALTIVLGNLIAQETSEYILVFSQYLHQLQIEGVRDIIPAFQTITVVYDLASLKKKYPFESAYEKIKHIIVHAAEAFSMQGIQGGRRMEIPVCYDISLAPDLAELAMTKQMDREEVIRLHTSVIYRVYMIGFLPGFAYMGTVDEKINTPRKETPRVRVPKGSVGIAGAQTGIYPVDSPGGWQLIGKTPLQMFDASQKEPCFLRPGDEVVFSAISLSEFNQLAFS
jgi:inhibitor of KinA